MLSAALYVRNGYIETIRACLRKRSQNFLLPYGF